MKTVITVYYAMIVVAIALLAVAPEGRIWWGVSLVVTGWIGGLTFAIIRKPSWFFDWIARLP